MTGQATEGGGRATFTVALQTQPSAAVTVSVTSRDPGEGTVSPPSLVFTVQNWETPQTVTVTGVDDDVDDGDVDWKVRLDPSSGDADYDGLAPVDVDVSTEDNDDAPTVTLALAPSSISEAREVSTVTATLSHPSVEPTTVTVTAVAGAYTVGPDAEIVIAAGATAADSDTASIAAVDDDLDNPVNRSVTVTGTASNGRGVGAVAGATLTLTDDDVAGLVLAPMPLEAAADGAGADYTVRLATEPTGPVTVAVVSDNADVEVPPGSLTFTASDWNMVQTVTVTASPDEDDYADSATLAHRASGGGYDGVSETLGVAVAEAGDTRILAASSQEREATYSIAGARVRVRLAPLSGEAVPSLEGSGFAVGRDAASREAVDVRVMGAVPASGLHLCLPVSDGLLAAAAGREPVLLHHDGGRWTAVPGSAYEAERMRVCAPGVVAFSPFAVGYTDTAPEFTGGFPEAFVWTEDEAIEPVTLPKAEGGDGDLVYALTPDLPAGLGREGRVLSGTPTEEFAKKKYTWTATDMDGQSAELEFTIEVVPAVALARARLAAINRSILPEVSARVVGERDGGGVAAVGVRGGRERRRLGGVRRGTVRGAGRVRAVQRAGPGRGRRVMEGAVERPVVRGRPRRRG